jgi:hypothetical protein
VETDEDLATLLIANQILENWQADNRRESIGLSIGFRMVQIAGLLAAGRNEPTPDSAVFQVFCGELYLLKQLLSLLHPPWPLRRKLCPLAAMLGLCFATKNHAPLRSTRCRCLHIILLSMVLSSTICRRHCRLPGSHAVNVKMNEIRGCHRCDDSIVRVAGCRH